MIHPKRKLIRLCGLLTVLALIYSFSRDYPTTVELNSTEENPFYTPYPINQRKSENPLNISAENIAIVVVLAEGTTRDFYKIALDSVECYSKAHGYEFILTTDINWGCDHLKDKFFRRHCVIAKILPKFEAVLHLDADIGVVEPTKKLENFLDSNIDITFYDRHSGPEIATESYLVRNTKYGLNLIEEFAEYGLRLPETNALGSDNAAIHTFLAEKLFPYNTIEIELCRLAWKDSKGVQDQLTYISCIRNIMGARIDFGKVRILKKGTGYVRDDFLTSGMWSPKRDFMLHGWKMNRLAEIPDDPILPVRMSNAQWYNPFIGDFDIGKCTLGNITWNYNPKLITTRDKVENELRKLEVKTATKQIELLHGLYDLVMDTNFRFY